MENKNERIAYLKERMAEQIAYKYNGRTFEEWLASNDGSKGCYVGWVGAYKEEYLEVMREAYEALDAEVKEGLPCTVIYYSDRRPATIVSVEYGKSGKNKGKVVKVGVRHNVFDTLDYYACKYNIREELEEHSEVVYYTLRRNKRWIEEGSTSRDWSTLLRIGDREAYIDPNF